MMKIAIIGVGNMGSAIALGLLGMGYAADSIAIANPSEERLNAFAKKSVDVSTNNKDVVEGADTVILAVKPYQLEAVATDIYEMLQIKCPVLVSVAAGADIAYIKSLFGDEIPVIRAMPNTPTICHAGVTGLYASHDVGAKQKEAIEKIFRTMGMAVWLDDESLLHALTAYTGAGPAYIYLLMQYLKEAAIHMGLPANMADLLMRQTTFGAAKMALESDEELSQLRREVTSPGGVTEAAVKSLESSGLDDIISRALDAGQARSEEMLDNLRREAE